MEKKNSWENYTAKQLKEVEEFAAGYIDFISNCKTERECVDAIVEEAEAAGYVELGTLIKENKKVKTGDKIYSV